MLTPSSSEYAQTKQILLGKAQMPPELRPLADWIDETFGVQVINIWRDTIDNGTKPRLGIIFEREQESDSFHNKDPYSGWNEKKQNRIAARYRELLQENPELHSQDPYRMNPAWVYFAAFKPAAITEINEDVPAEQVNELLRQINNPDIWHIARAFGGAGFFVYTDAQLKKYKESAERKQWADAYFTLLKFYDEFGYLERDKFDIYLDSKENFDTNYQSNWYYYYK